MFYGSHAINMDSKGRIAIPSRVRELLEDCNGNIVLTAHTENLPTYVSRESVARNST
jgi:MraZ protein